jgi:co-chaperonin GroES (HSP10)
MEIQPLHKKVYIAEHKVERKTESGIILEGATSVRETRFASVLAVGSEVTKVAVGDKIILDWGKCAPVKIGDVERAMIDEEHIMAIAR